MSPKKQPPKVMASDGLLARDNGAWGMIKLNFLDQYLPPALVATRRKPERHFIDLFAGPGRNKDARGTGAEFEGGTIRALKAADGTSHMNSFTHLTAVNLDEEDHRLLAERVRRVDASGEARIPATRRQLICGDANHHSQHIMHGIDRRAYVLVFADPNAPSHLHFSTIQSLRNQGHISVDLYMLYPGDMALRRLFGNPDANADVLTRFYGTDRWREFTAKRFTDAGFPELMRQTQALYMEQLRSVGWAHVQVVRDVNRSGDASLYEMILASNHVAGKQIGAWSAKKEATKDQLGLF